MWLGYLEEHPDYWTQGEIEAELQENLINIYETLRDDDRGSRLIQFANAADGLGMQVLTIK